MCQDANPRDRVQIDNRVGFLEKRGVFDPVRRGEQLAGDASVRLQLEWHGAELAWHDLTTGPELKVLDPELINLLSSHRCNEVSQFPPLHLRESGDDFWVYDRCVGHGRHHTQISVDLLLERF